MSEQTRVVVIGGGIVGCSVLYGLADLGWTDTLLIEKRNLTSGSTWHAAGNVTYFGHYPSISRLYVDSVQVYLKAEQESGQNIGFHPTGSLRLATTSEEFAYYRKLEPMFDQLGVNYHVISTSEISNIHPLLVTDCIYGAAHTPEDGHLDASGVTFALAKAAKMKGAHIRTHCKALSLERKESGDWIVRTTDNDIITQHVVIATSFWAREFVENLGLNLPVYPIEHNELITDRVSELQSLDFELPSLRDPYVPANVRQEGDGLLIGIYESQPKPWAVDGIPDDFAEDLLAPDMRRLEPHLPKLMERIPPLESCGLKKVINGPICYTPDGCPLLGPCETHPGLWLATGFCIGIGTAGGSGDYLAKWIINGSPEYELPIVHPSRFSGTLTQQQCLELIHKTYASGYTLQEK